MFRHLFDMFNFNQPFLRLVFGSKIPDLGEGFIGF